MFRSIWIVIVIGICTSALCAQGTRWLDPEFEGSGFAGGSFIGDHQYGNVGVHYGGGYQVGGRVNENLNDYWNADLEYSFANQPLRFTNLTPNAPSLTFGQTVHNFSYSVSYIPLGGFERFRPYAKLGTGATLFYIHGDSRDDALALGVHLRDDWKFMMNWGGGFKYMADEQTALLFDFKDFVSAVPSYGLPRVGQVVNGQFQPGFRPTGLLHHIQLNIGVAYRWNDW